MRLVKCRNWYFNPTLIQSIRYSDYSQIDGASEITIYYQTPEENSKTVLHVKKGNKKYLDVVARTINAALANYANVETIFEIKDEV